jgi:hypothetical protein
VHRVAGEHASEVGRGRLDHRQLERFVLVARKRLGSIGADEDARERDEQEQDRERPGVRHDGGGAHRHRADRGRPHQKEAPIPDHAASAIHSARVKLPGTAGTIFMRTMAADTAAPA